MGTKNNPGAFDCYANAHPDEPMFVLLGRDKHAAGLIRLWAIFRARDGEDDAKVQEALACARAVEAWRLSKGGLPGDDAAPFSALELEATRGMDEHPEGYDGSCDCDLCRSYD